MDINLPLQGKTSEFPAFESYMQIDNAEPIALFRHASPKGNTPFNFVYGLTQHVNVNIPIKTYHQHHLFISRGSHKEAINDGETYTSQNSISH